MLPAAFSIGKSDRGMSVCLYLYVHAHMQRVVSDVAVHFGWLVGWLVVLAAFKIASSLSSFLFFFPWKDPLSLPLSLSHIDSNFTY